jgi:hypothetical protein
MPERRSGWTEGILSFLTSAPEGDEWSASRPSRTLLPRNEPPVPIVQEAGWAPEPDGHKGQRKHSLPDRTQSP